MVDELYHINLSRFSVFAAKQCGFFEWFDVPTCPRGLKVGNKVHEKISKLEDEIKELKKERLEKLNDEILISKLEDQMRELSYNQRKMLRRWRKKWWSIEPARSL